MRASKPDCRQRVRFIHMNHVKSPVSDERPDCGRRGQPQPASRCVMHADSRLRCAMAQGRTLGSEQFSRVAALVHPLQQKKKLILPAAPFLFQIHQQRNHGVASRVSLGAVTNFPSFLYFKRTVRAAI